MFDLSFFARRRFWLVWVASLAVLGLLYYTDPSGGAGLKALVLGLTSGVLAVGLAHGARKALFDYAGFDLSLYIHRAAQESTGAGLVVLAVCAVLSALLQVFASLLRV